MCGTINGDHSLQILDYGPGGYVGPVELKFEKKPTLGAVWSVVACTDDDVAVNLRDDSVDEILLHVVARTRKNDFGINHFTDSKWGSEVKVAEPPIKKGVRFCLMINYETEGYRIFINGKEIALYKKYCKTEATRLQITSSKIFKVTYLTSAMKNI